MTLPEWLRDEIDRRAEQDRLARKAAYDEWAAAYIAYAMEGRPDDRTS
jgi:hypothetical protein